MLMLRKKQKNNSGFTLIELMIVVAIVAVLAAIAIPSYSSYVMRGKRAEGRAYLMNAAALLERYYSDNNVYATAANTMPGTVATAAGATSESGYYTGSMTVSTPFQTYTITATSNFTDADCGNLTLTHDGTRGKTGPSSVSDCWGK